MNTLRIELFLFKTMRMVAEDLAWIGSRASEIFLDINVWEGLGIGCFTLNRPILVRDVDGAANKQGDIEYYCRLKVEMGKREENMMFYL